MVRRGPEGRDERATGLRPAAGAVSRSRQLEAATSTHTCTTCARSGGGGAYRVEVAIMSQQS